MQKEMNITSNPGVGEDEILDCSGLLCPLPVCKTSLALAKLSAGSVLKLVCTDPGSLEDIPALARQANHDLVAVDESGETQTFWLRKGVAK